MDLLTQLEHIESRLKNFQHQHTVLSAENETLKTRISALEIELASKETAINNIKEQNKITKLAKGLSSGEDSVEFKAQLDDLIKEIDLCINLIKR